MIENDYIALTDLGCIRTMQYLGFELVTIDKSNSNRYSFYFKKEGPNGESLERAITDYLNDSIEVKAKTFYEGFQLLKNMMHT